MKRVLIACMTVVFMLTVSCGGGKTLSMRDEYFFRNAEGLPLGDVDNGCPYKVNYRTGAVTPVCVDPLCGHDEDSGCPFYEAEQCVPSTVREHDVLHPRGYVCRSEHRRALREGHALRV